MAGTMALDPEALLWKPTKTIFIPGTVRVATWDEISAVTMKHVIPKLVDHFFKEDPLFRRLKSNRKEVFVGGREIVQAFSVAKARISLV
jgi:hypothetical protein